VQASALEALLVLIKPIPERARRDFPRPRATARNTGIEWGKAGGDHEKIDAALASE